MTDRLTTFGAAVAACALALAASAVPHQQTAAPAPGRTYTPEELATFRASLPDGAAREVTIRVCGQCHEPNRAASLRTSS